MRRGRGGGGRGCSPVGRILVENILLVGRGYLLSVLPGLWWSVFIPTKSGHSRVKLNSKFHTAQYPELGEIISGRVMHNSVHGALCVCVVSGKFPKLAQAGNGAY